MNTKKLAIFDLDGTLYRTDAVYVEAVKRATKDLDVPQPSDQLLLSLIGETAMACATSILPAGRRSLRRDLIDRVDYYERRLTPEFGATYPGVETMLSELEQLGFDLALCTHGSRAYADLVLDTCGLAGRFRVITSIDSHRSKTKMVSSILTRLRPELAVVVGDRWQDYCAAANNGLPFVGATYGYGGSEIEATDFCVASAAEIAAQLTRFVLFLEIEQALREMSFQPPLIVGINGVDLSGKTCFAKGLSAFLRGRTCDTQVIHLDDFHHLAGIRREGEDEIKAYIKNAFNLDLLAEQVLDPVKDTGQIDITLNLLDLDSDKYTKRVRYRAGTQTVIILEGVLLFREPIDPFIDYRIYLDISFDEVLRRAEQRDVPKYGQGFLDKYRSKYIPIQQWYLDKYEPREMANMVIDNNDPDRPVILTRR